MKSVTVGQPTAAYLESMGNLELIDALMGGTKAMREGGRTFLPQEELESDTAYENRKTRSFLLNAFDRTVQRLTGEVFSKELNKGENFNEALSEWCDDVDGEGKNLDRFSWEVFAAALSRGYTFLLVDYPAANIMVAEDGKPYFVDEDGTEKLFTKGLEKEKNYKPYLVHVLPKNLIGCRTAVINGKRTLTQIRIKETTEEDEGEFGTKMVERIRVINRGSWQLWVKNDVDIANVNQTEKKEDVFELEKEGLTTLDEIPLISIFFGRRISAITADAPLQGLADLNLQHYQSASDQRNILHFARLVIFFGKLLQVDESTNKVKFGANQLVHGNDPASDLKSVEHQGAAIGAGRQDLKDLEELMGMYGLTQMMPKTGNVTATGRAIDSSESNSALKTYALVFQDAINQAFYYVSLLLGIGENAGQILVNTEFSNIIADTSAEVLIKAYVEKILSREVVFNELKRRGMVANDTDFDEMVKAINEEKEAESMIAPATVLPFGKKVAEE